MEDEALKRDVMDSVYSIAKEKKLNSLEKPKQLKLIFKMWTSDDNWLTPTQKMKRNVARERYEKEIAELYEAGPLPYPKK